MSKNERSQHKNLLCLRPNFTLILRSMCTTHPHSAEVFTMRRILQLLSLCLFLNVVAACGEADTESVTPVDNSKEMPTNNPDLCPGGGCTQTCVGGLCNRDCGGTGKCSQTCSGGLCNFDCASGECAQTCGGGRCNFECSGGGCTQRCTGGECELACSGGDCLQDCSTGACTKTCSGEQCR